MTDRGDTDTFGGIFWVPSKDFDRSWQAATPGESCDEIKRLRAENIRLREALTWFVDNDETNEGDVPMPEHGGRTWNEINAYWIEGLNAARAALDPDVQKERRAKALSELAEMDADLLDIDPRVKS
jgi:hypothetical protein